jgi:hypothetical protein
MRLPFKEENATLPNNRPQAEQRLKSLKKRLLSDVKYRQDYANFMNTIINKGYATKISDENATASEGHVWYLPHHGVYHRQKTDSLGLFWTVQLVTKGSLSTIIYCKART